MKCIICKREADYIYSGDSICEHHYNEKIGKMSSRKEEYYELLKQYKGDIPILHKLFKDVEESMQCKLGLATRIPFLKELNTFINNKKIPRDNINQGMRGLIKIKQLNLGYIFASFHRMNEPEETKMEIDSVTRELLERKRHEDI